MILILAVEAQVVQGYENHQTKCHGLMIVNVDA